jgi:formylglycine-generating enzyme required for sulfatase activity
MVYVPDGSFWLGDNGVSGTTTSLPQYQLYANGVSGQGYNITSEASTQFCIPGGGCGGGSLFVPDAANAGTTLSASFPKGYKGFYAMKYEASQQHYVDFLNTLTSAQQSAVGFTYTTNRINISVSSSVYLTTTPYVPIGNIKSSDFLAYLDWAGLRPMTEMEFEKACRGTATPVTSEYAWGNTNIVNHINTFNNAGAASETPALSTANANLAASDPVNCTGCGPIRCGAFANSSSTRASSGSSAYGIMELSGNMMEIVVRLTAPVFTGLHGNGIITTAGAADVANWNTSTYNARGGSFSTRNCDTQFNTVADRHQFVVTSRSVDYGIRGVHTKPITASETK